MQSWLDGEPCNSLPLDDRGLQYGDGLFETIRVHKGKIPLLSFHLARLQTGAAALGIFFEIKTIENQLNQVSQHCETDHSIIKLILTRGSSVSGYACKTSHSRIILQLRECQSPPEKPEVLRCSVAAVALSRQPALAGIKHLNRLENVLAANRLDEGFDQALLLDTQGNVIETQHSNLFWRSGEQFYTPALTFSGVAGVARRIVMETLASQCNIKFETGFYSLSELLEADEVFCTNSVRGIESIQSIDKHQFNDNKFTSQLFVKWWDYFYEAAENAA